MYIIYKVVFGDTLDSICSKFHITKESFFLQNDLKKIQEGDRVIIDKERPKVHIVKPGETLDTIAQLYNIDKEEIIKKNSINRIFNGLNIFI